MEDRRWNNFVGILATAQHVTREIEHRPVGDYGGILDLRAPDADFDAWAISLFRRAVAEIERLRTFADDLEDRLDAAESALADAGIAQCQGDGCGKYVRAVLMHNDLCDECHATEVSIGNIFGKGDLDAEARAQLSQRDCLRRDIR